VQTKAQNYITLTKIKNFHPSFAERVLCSALLRHFSKLETRYCTLFTHFKPT